MNEPWPATEWWNNELCCSIAADGFDWYVKMNIYGRKEILKTFSGRDIPRWCVNVDFQIKHVVVKFLSARHDYIFWTISFLLLSFSNQTVFQRFENKFDFFHAIARHDFFFARDRNTRLQLFVSFYYKEKLYSNIVS
jgi:hypothetical protein